MVTTKQIVVALACCWMLDVSTMLATAQTVGPDFAADYSAVDLGSPTGVPGSLGGITFLDSDTILIGGAANSAAGAIYQIDVTRDAGTGSVNGFAGPATLYATAPNIDGGLEFGPAGVLFFTTFSSHEIGQIRPGSAAPDRIDSLAGSGIPSSLGTLRFVPPGFAGAGQLKVASYNGDTWHTVALSPDGAGSFDIGSASPAIDITGGPEGIVYVDAANDGFSVDSVLISEFDGNAIGAYEIDGNGDPIPGTRRDFLTNLTGAEGAVFDPVTGDFFFSTFGGGDRIVYVTGFINAVPEPGAGALVGFTLAVFGVRRSRRKLV